MVNIRLLIACGGARHVELESSDWIVYGTRPRKVATSIDPGTSFSRIVNKTKELPGEYSLLYVGTEREKEVRAYRGITSSYDIFFTRHPSDGTIIIGDHFRDIISELPVHERTVPESVATDQLLFGTRPHDTYVDEIGRVGHGESLEWEHGSTPRVELVDKLTTNESISPAEAKRRLDHYFSTIINSKKFLKPTTMLSGGVDSSLIHTYLNTSETVSAAFNSPEFEFEIEYAEQASELLETDHHLIRLDESEFFNAVENTTAATGHPLQHLQATLMYAAIANTPHQTYFNGQLADGIFGTGTAALAYLIQYTSRLAQFAPSISPEINELKSIAHQLERSATDPNGLAMQFVIHSDQERVESVLDKDSIHERKLERLRYVRDRIDIGGRSKYGDHMHLGHFIDFFQDNTVTPWRHAAHSAGKTLHTPFAGRKVIETVIAVPPEQRYVRLGLPTRNNFMSISNRKYLLKDLLNQRLPSYNAKKPKGSSGLPLRRYFEDGPLSNAFDRYSVPDFVPDQKHDLIREGTDHVSWYAFSYAVWRENILRNQDLELFETTTVIER